MALNPTELAKAIRNLQTELEQNIFVNIDKIKDSAGNEYFLYDEFLSKFAFDANNNLNININADTTGILKKADLNFDANGYLNVNAQVVANPSNLDISLSSLRDALKGADNKDFSTLEADVEAINSKISKCDTDNVKVVSEVAYDSTNDRKKISIENDAVGLAKESTLSDIKAQLDVALSSRASESTLSAINSKLNDIGGHAYSQLIEADETAAQEITLDTKGLKLLEVCAVATTATNFYLDVSNDNTNWIEGYYSWSNVTEVAETYWNGFRYVKLRSDAAGASGDKVTLILSAK